jgi:hypothetical protein
MISMQKKQTKMKKLHDKESKPPLPTSFLYPSKGEKPNTKVMTELENGKWILDGENFVTLEETIKEKEDIHCEEDLIKVKQHSKIWFDLRDDSEGGLVQYLKKNVFKEEYFIRVVRASTLPMELGLFTTYVSKELGLKFSKQDEFKNSLLGIKNVDIGSEVNMQFGNNSEDKVTKAFFKKFNRSGAKVTVKETGTYILKDEDVKDVQIWCSPDGLFEIEDKNSFFPTLKGSWEAKSTSPFFKNKEDEKLYDFNPYMYPSPNIKSYYIPQKISEIYSTNSECGFIGFHSLFRGTTFFSTVRSEKTDRFKKLMFLRIQWKYEYYKDFSEKDTLDDNPFKNWEHDNEFIDLLIDLSTGYQNKYELSHEEFMENLKFIKYKPFI